MLKVELHAHTSDDPQDAIPYDARSLIERAADLGYDALAITLHNRQFDVSQLTSYGRDRGVVLIPGIERTVCGKHVLLLNFSREAEDVESFEDIRRLKAKAPGLVIAPHPFYPAGCCLGRYLDQYADLFDAVELNAFYTTTFDFNRRALRWAQAHHKTVVGNADVHRLTQLGATYSLIDALPEASEICKAIRAGRVEVRTRPISLAQAVTHFGSLVAADLVKRFDVEAEWPSAVSTNW